MKSFQLKFESASSFEIELKHIQNVCACLPHSTALFYVVWTDNSRDKVKSVVKTIERLFPESLYYGNETSGNIVEGNLAIGIAVTCFLFEDRETKARLLWVEEGTEYETLQDLWDFCKTQDGLKAVELIPTISYIEGLKMDCNIPGLDDDVLIFGGASVNYINPSLGADIIAKGHSMSGTGLAAILYFGECLNISSTYVLGWKGLGRYMKVTKNTSKVICEIDGQPARSIYEKYLDLKDEDNDNLVFPVIVEEDGVEFIRTPRNFQPDKSMRMIVNVPEGAMLRIAYGDKNTILESLYEKCDEISEFSPQVIKAYSCAARRLFWGDADACKETIPLQDIAPVCGFYSGGEILRFGDKLRVLNSTLCLISFREGKGRLVKRTIQVKKDTSLISRITHFIGVIAAEHEEALEMAQSANKAKTSFLNSMSHDIRTPLNAIRGFTSMAMKSAGDEEKVMDYLGKIDVSGQQLLSLINQVLEMSRIESGKVELNEKPVNIREKFEALSTILTEQAKTKGLVFNRSLVNMQHFHVLADDARMGQIILNIAGNAMKYTPTGGVIDFILTEVPCEREGHARYVFTVSDTGIGMSDEYQKVMYEPFTREKTSTVSKIQGSGLGMSIVKNLVDVLGGKIEVHSAPGKGTRFDVTIDFRIDEEGEADALQIESACYIPFAGKRILLVEDNELNREIARFILEDKGFRIEEADDGDIAVEKVRKIVDNGDYGYYDAILMDIQMPRMNGFEATREIRRLTLSAGFHIPVIAMTANAFQEDRKAAIDAGMDEHVAKPIDVAGLVEVLAKFIK